MSDSVTVVFNGKRPSTQPQKYRSQSLHRLVSSRESASATAIRGPMHPKTPPAPFPPTTPQDDSANHVRIEYTCRSIEEFTSTVKTPRKGRRQRPLDSLVPGLLRSTPTVGMSGMRSPATPRDQQTVVTTPLKHPATESSSDPLVPAQPTPPTSSTGSRRIAWEALAPHDIPVAQRKHVLKVAIEAMALSDPNSPSRGASAGSQVTRGGRHSPPAGPKQAHANVVKKAAALYADVLEAYQSAVKTLQLESGSMGVPLVPPPVSRGNLSATSSSHQASPHSQSLTPRSPTNAHPAATRRTSFADVAHYSAFETPPHDTLQSIADETQARLLKAVREENKSLQQRLDDLHTAHQQIQQELSASFDSYRQLQTQHLDTLASLKALQGATDP